MWSSTKLIVAAIHGFAVGWGLELALWSDLVVASEDARIGQPEVREGWVLWSVVPWLIGPQKAKCFMLSGDMIQNGVVIIRTNSSSLERSRLIKRSRHREER